jgi:hypothetical protein
MPLGTLSSCNDPKTTDFVSKNFAGRSAPVRAALNSLDTVVCFVEHDGAGRVPRRRTDVDSVFAPRALRGGALLGGRQSISPCAELAAKLPAKP